MSKKICSNCRSAIQVFPDMYCLARKLHTKDGLFDNCYYFEQKVITNGDVVRQMSNEELAKLIVPKVIFCDGCPVKCAEKDIPQSKVNPFGADVVEDICTKRVEAWLNAPAESEGKDA